MRECEKKIGWRRRLSVFLCLLFVIPGILGAIPQARLEVQAASEMHLSFRNDDFEMTKNTKGFYVGDYVVVEYGSTSGGYLSMKKGASYKSSNPGVASVDKTSGLVKPKKTGTTQITASYKGVSETCTLKIVSSLGVKAPKGLNGLEKRANALVKTYGRGITKSNRYQAVNANNQYKVLCKEAENKIDNTVYGGRNYFSEETGCVNMRDNGRPIYKVCMPALMRAYVRSYTLDNFYVGARNPIGTGGGKLFKIKSVSGKGRQITANLEKKVSEDQIFGLKAVVSGKDFFDTEVVKDNRAEFPLYIRDKKTGHRYYAIATTTKGSKKLSIKLQSGKLKKGGSYQIIVTEDYPITDQWTKTGKTSFKAK